MVDNNSDTLWRQIEEEIRREQFAKLWNNYGTYFVLAVVALIAAVGGYKYYQSESVAAAEAAGAKFELARDLIADKKIDEATTALSEITTSGARGYAALADLQLAGLKAKEGKTAEAVAAYEEVANSGRADPLLKGFARLQAAGLRLGEADFTEMQNRVTDLAGDASPWRGTARELLGVSAFKAGKFDEARKYMEQILADQSSSQAARERAEMVMGSIVERDLANTAPASSANSAAGGTGAGANEAGAGTADEAGSGTTTGATSPATTPAPAASQTDTDTQKK